MSFFQLVLKAQKLEQAKRSYYDEKIQALESDEKNLKPHYTWKQKIKMAKIRFTMKMKDFFYKWSVEFKKWRIYQKCILMSYDGTFENFIWKSVIGFIGGTLLTYMFFLFIVFQLNFSLSVATLFCSIFGVILTIGLSFSFRIRCVVFLLLPQFFSKRGRQALMAYAFILTLSGPAKNTLYNIGVLSESLACGQEQLKMAIKDVLNLIKQPFRVLRHTISKVIKNVKETAKKIEMALLSIKRIIWGIVGVVKSASEWLGSIINICNKKLGTPFERCEKVFDGAIADCRAKLGPLFSEVCNLVTVVKYVCYVVKPFDFICILVATVSDAISDTIHKETKRFSNQMKAMFFVKINFSHSFHMHTNKSETYKDIAIRITSKIKSKTDKFTKIFDWMSLITTIFILFMLIRVVNYRRKWLIKDHFDNKYITDNFREIDIIRARKNQETVLPLNRHERKKYIPLTSISLIASERIKLTKSVIFLALTSFKLGLYITVDYSLHWILSIIRYHGTFHTNMENMNTAGVHVAGSGYLAELYRNIIKSVTPTETNMSVDSRLCLPDPLPPDYDRCIQIGLLIAFCWIIAIFEPYGFRLRQIIMGYYYPDRAKQRAVWLYNHIIRSRGSFLKYIRRQLRRKYGMAGDKGIERVAFTERIIAVCPLLNLCFRQRQKICLLCGAIEREESRHIECPSPGCVGLFCIECFADLQNLCTICRAPMDYGDLSDMSEERDSSDDQGSLHGTTPFLNNPLIRESLRGGADSQIKLGKDEIYSSIRVENAGKLVPKYRYRKQKKGNKQKKRGFQKLSRCLRRSLSQNSGELNIAELEQPLLMEIFPNSR